MNPDDIIALNEQIAGMARAGLPLDQGLESLARDMGRGRLRTVTETLARDLRDGHPLAEALERQKGRIPPYYANLVTAGVQTGRLPEVLSTLSEYARTVSATRTTVLDALLYPGLVLVFGFGLMVALSLFVIPQFDHIYSDFGMTLPDMTWLILQFGRYPVEMIAVPAGIALAVVVLAWVALRRTSSGREVWARMVYRVPLVGGLIRAARLQAFADLLSMLVEYEVPLPLAFQLAGGASADPVMVARAMRVSELLSQGVPLAEAFRGRGLVPEWVAWLAGAGEQRGGLVTALRQIAEVYRRQVETRSAMLGSILPPFIVVSTAGLLTGFFAMGLFLPLIKLVEGLSN